MVAGDRSNPYFFVSVRLPTGSPVAMNSVTTAYRTCRARLVRGGTPQVYAREPGPQPRKPGVRRERRHEVLPDYADATPIDVTDVPVWPGWGRGPNRQTGLRPQTTTGPRPANSLTVFRGTRMMARARKPLPGGAVTATLLCVDDSKTMRKVLEITFAGENYRTVLAESSEDALGKLRSEKPAVALVDANLGAQSGYDLCQQIKREAPQVGVIILASKQQPFDKARGATVGSDDFIDKPFDTQQLIDKVAAVLRRVAEGARAPAAAAAAPVAAAAAPLQPMASAGLGQPAGGLGARPRANTLAYGSSAAPQPPTNAQQPSVSRVPT